MFYIQLCLDDINSLQTNYLKKKVAPDVGLEPTTLGLLELRWLASKSPMLYRLS